LKYSAKNNNIVCFGFGSFGDDEEERRRTKDDDDDDDVNVSKHI
jgi:hypothetical protein